MRKIKGTLEGSNWMGGELPWEGTCLGPDILAELRKMKRIQAGKEPEKEKAPGPDGNKLHLWKKRRKAVGAFSREGAGRGGRGSWVCSTQPQPLFPPSLLALLKKSHLQPHLLEALFPLSPCCS